MELEKLIEQLEEKARELQDGHFTIMKFTTGYKGFFAAPFSNRGGPLGRAESFPTLSALIKDMLEKPEAHNMGGW